jgi:hypothetical protein
MEVSYWLVGWVVEMGSLYLAARNAKSLEGSFLSGLMVGPLAPMWSAEGIKLFAWLSMFGSTLWFVAGLMSPELRF